LIDDPSRPRRRQDIELLAAARSLPEEIEYTLRKPAEHFADALSRLTERLARKPLDATGETLALAQLYRDAASWFEEQAIGYPAIDHADELFVELTFRRPATQYRERAASLCKHAGTGSCPRAQDLRQEYERLAVRFRLEMSSFERKRFVNLSHEPNKAMNLNSYIGLLGRDWRFARQSGELRLEPSDGVNADLSVPDADYVLMLDADSIIAPDYTVRLAHFLSQPPPTRAPPV